MLAAFLLLGVFVHSLLLYAIFDIYYSSPIVKVTQNFIVASNLSAPSPADRIIFFSADGLRARTFFDHPERSPFLHELINNSKAAWGVSQSHVPTESRPGHVALMAGFYEDVSAVTRGWKHNPVPFDSTLNQSARAFLWGSPDIVHLFTSNIPHSYAETYSPELEDFASENASKLDEWVFQRVEDLFKRGAKGQENGAQIRRDLSTKRAIFFLHLLGLDTNGHGNKPRSEQYLENIGVVDEGVRKIVELVERYFSDNRTTFLFTSDHGMTDWGSHGDGTPNEVETPFVAWGAGIAPNGAQNRLQIVQVDIAPLQSALLGFAIPANNFGVVPMQLLRLQPQKYLFQTAYANFKQMAEQFTIRRTERRAHSFRWFFTECPEMSFDALTKIENEILRLAQLKRYEAAWKTCMNWIPHIRSALNYFHRYNQFSQGLAISAIFCLWNLVLFASLVGNYSHLCTSQIYLPNGLCALPLLFVAILVWANGWPLVNHFYFLTPLYLVSVALKMFGIEALFSQIFVSRHVEDLGIFLRELFQFVVVAFPLGAFVVPLLVFVFFERAVISVIFLTISFCWPVQVTLQCWKQRKVLNDVCDADDDVNNYKSKRRLLSAASHNEFAIRERQHRPTDNEYHQSIVCDKGAENVFPRRRRKIDSSCYKWHLFWFALCILLAVFPLLDTVGNSPRPLLVILAELLCCSLIIFSKPTSSFNSNSIVSTVGTLHLITFLLLSVDYFVGPKQLTRPFAWLSVPLAIGVPLVLARRQFHLMGVAERLALWSVCLQVPYSLLSISHEALFNLLFSALLFVYVNLEGNEEEKKERRKANCFYLDGNEILNSLDHKERRRNGFAASEWMRALFLVICIEMAFFGTGNIASLNSFNPSFLRHFVSVFSPFLMAALLLLKVFIPLLLVALYFVGAIIISPGSCRAEATNNKKLVVAAERRHCLARLATLVALITNTMAMVFFYCLRTEGSWLMIGISISNYVICLVCSSATYLLLHLGYFLLS